MLDPLVGRRCGRRGRTQVQSDPAEEPPVFGDVVPAQGVESLLSGRREAALRQQLRVAADVLVALVAGGRGHQQHRRVGPGHGDLAVLRGRLAADGHDADTGLELQRPRDAHHPPLLPRITRVSDPSVSTVTLCGLRRPAAKAICPGRSAVRRITMTWSTGLEKASRVYFTPPAV